MELIVDRAVFLSELGLLQGVVERKNTLPVLAHLLLRVRDAGDGKGLRVEMAATDLEIGLVTEFDAQCLSPGGITVSARKLFEIVRALPDADVHLKSTDGRQLQISCGRSQYSVVGLPEGDFPAIPTAAKKGEVSILREALRKIVSQTSFAITTDESRFAVAGGLFVLAKDSVAMVATDGHRLAYSHGAIAGSGPDAPTQVLLPRKTLLELKKLVEGGADESVLHSRDDKHVFFRSGSRTMISRILEGSFPQYDRVIPLGHPRTVGVARDEFLAAVRRVAILSSDRTHAIRVSFLPDRMELKAESPDLGEAREHVPMEFSGPELTISFNALYVIDFLSAVGSERIEIRLKDAETQALFLPLEREGQKAEDASYRYVIMPMRA